MAGSSGECETVRVVVSNNGDIVNYLLDKKFSSLDFDDKAFIHKLKPTPVMKNLINTGHQGKNNRAFNINWYSKYEWLTGSEIRNKLFCWHCLLFNERTRTPWNSTGYFDLKHINESLKKHARSEEHTYSALKFKLLGKQNIQTFLNSAYRENILKHNKTVEENREIMKRLIDMVIYLATQEQSFRGHNETSDSINQGNFRQLACLLSKYDNKFKVFLDESTVFSGLSKTIQNDLIESINVVVSEVIFSEIKNAECFSWQIDETTDIKCLSQLSVVFRYVNRGKVVERFMGFFDVSSGKNAEQLFNFLTENFKNFNIENKLVGQTYDGASVMSGDLHGLQARIKGVAPQALFIHCYAHRLNLILQDAATKIKECRIFFANVSGISAFFSNSTKRMKVLDEISGRRLPSGSNTRWNFKSRTIEAVINHKSQLIEVFDTFVNSDEFSRDKETIRESVGFKKILGDFTFLFLLNTFHLIYEHTDVIFNIVQSKFTDVAYCKNRIQNLLVTLKKFRDDNYFNKIFSDVCEVIGQPAKRRKTDHDGFGDSTTYYKRLFNEILDITSTQIDVRFKDFDQLIFLDLANKSKFTAFKVEFPHTCLNALLQSYPKLFDKVKLQNELRVWYSDPSIFGELSDFTDILEFIHANDLQNEVPQIYKLLCLILSLPATSASVERSFSALKRIKTCTRNSMGQSRLSNLGKISIEAGLIKQLQECHEFKFYEKVTDHFAITKTRRIDLIYKQ